MSSESSKNWIIVAEFSGSVYAKMAENILDKIIKKKLKKLIF